jgi:hypothetical protein
MQSSKMLKKLALIVALLSVASSAQAWTYGCGFTTSNRQGICLTRINPSEFGKIRQVAVRVTNASGQTYNYGGSNWSLGRSDIRIRYNLPMPKQVHAIAGSHCVQFSNYSHACKNSSYRLFL